MVCVDRATSCTSAATAVSRSAAPTSCARSRPRKKCSSTAARSCSSIARRRAISSAPRRGSSASGFARAREIVDDAAGGARCYARFLDRRSSAQDDPWAERAHGKDAAEFAPLRADARARRRMSWLDVGPLAACRSAARASCASAARHRGVPHGRRRGLRAARQLPAPRRAAVAGHRARRRASPARCTTGSSICKQRQRGRRGRRLHADVRDASRRRPRRDRLPARDGARVAFDPTRVRAFERA